MNDAPDSVYKKPVSQFTPFAWDDALRLDSALTEDERAIRDAAHDFCQEKLFPRVLMANRREHFDREIMNEFGEMGFLGATLEGYGCAGVNYVSYGLISREVERVDSGYRSQAAVRRVRWVLWVDGAGCRVGPGLDADAREGGGWRVPAERVEDLDHQCADRRCACRVGEG